MAGEYRVLGIYPRGHLMEFVRPSLDPNVLPTAAVDCAAEGDEITVAGWPIARQHPRGEDSTVFVTIEDENRRRPGHPVASGFPGKPPPSGQPGAAGARNHLTVGWHRQPNRIRRAGHPPPRTHARRPRLALRGTTNPHQPAIQRLSDCPKAPRVYLMKHALILTGSALGRPSVRNDGRCRSLR